MCRVHHTDLYAGYHALLACRLERRRKQFLNQAAAKRQTGNSPCLGLYRHQRSHRREMQRFAVVEAAGRAGGPEAAVFIAVLGQAREKRGGFVLVITQLQAELLIG